MGKGAGKGGRAAVKDVNPGLQTVSSTGRVQVTWEQLAKHNTPEDLWVAIRGKVYDLTTYQNRHPGGFRLLRLGAGRDVTHLFEAYHPLKILDSDILDKFEVGDLLTSEYPTYPPMSPFYRTLKARVQTYLDDKGQDSQYTSWVTQLVRVGVLAGMILGFYALSACGPAFLPPVYADSLLFATVFSILAGVGRALIGVHTMHDSSHGCYGNKPWLWNLTGWISNDLSNGASYYGWLHQHVLGHHVYCNSYGIDPDVRPFPLRLAPDIEWAWYHRYQHIWAHFAYCMLSWSHRFEDFSFISNQAYDSIRMAPMSLETKVMFWGGKALWFFWQLVLPLMLGVSWKHMLFCHFIAEATGSYYLSISFQANHVAEEVSFQNHKDGKHTMDWAAAQAETTQDYGHGSWPVFLLTGGLNYQVVHHLLPGISQLHYMNIQPIVKTTCEEFGIKYNHRPSFCSAAYSHVHHLYTMGQPSIKAD